MSDPCCSNMDWSKVIAEAAQRGEPTPEHHPMCQANQIAITSKFAAVTDEGININDWRLPEFLVDEKDLLIDPPNFPTIAAIGPVIEGDPNVKYIVGNAPRKEESE